MARTLRSLLLVALVSSPALALAADGEKCTIATKPETEVGKACAEGGVKKAKAVMKAMTKEAKKKGLKLDCDSCHKDTEAKFDLTPDGKDQFAKMLETLGKK